MLHPPALLVTHWCRYCKYKGAVDRLKKHYAAVHAGPDVEVGILLDPEPTAAVRDRVTQARREALILGRHELVAEWEKTMEEQGRNDIYNRAKDALTLRIDALKLKIANIDHFLASSTPAPSAALGKAFTPISRQQRLVFY
ncbi:hypothetical protein JCM16303_003273 [Sporobolomyces ruberrimus]